MIYLHNYWTCTYHIFFNFKIGSKTSNTNRLELEGNTRKRYKVTSKVTNSLSRIMEKNHEKTIQAIAQGENQVDPSHKILLELEHKKHNETMEMQKSALQQTTEIEQ